MPESTLRVSQPTQGLTGWPQGRLGLALLRDVQCKHMAVPSREASRCLYDHFSNPRQAERERCSVLAVGWIVESIGAVLNAESLTGKRVK